MQKLSSLIIIVLIGAGLLLPRALNTEFKVNSYTIGDQIQPAIGIDGAGNIVSTWASEVIWDEENEQQLSEIFAQIFDSEGNIDQIIEYSLDITERKRAEERSRKLKTVL